MITTGPGAVKWQPRAIWQSLKKPIDIIKIACYHNEVVLMPVFVHFFRYLSETRAAGYAGGGAA